MERLFAASYPPFSVNQLNLGENSSTNDNTGIMAACVNCVDNNYIELQNLT